VVEVGAEVLAVIGHLVTLRGLRSTLVSPAAMGDDLSGVARLGFGGSLLQRRDDGQPRN
jgi:hypothetical protein